MTTNPYQSPRSSDPAQRRDRSIFAMTISFLVISMLGCSFIFTFWMAHHALSIGLERCVGFIAIIGGVHFVGYRLWDRQRKAVQERKQVATRDDTGFLSQSVPHGLFWLVLVFLGFLLLWSLML